LDDRPLAGLPAKWELAILWLYLVFVF
jgi:hypothetical protein